MNITRRQNLVEILEFGTYTAHDLASLTDARIKDVLDDLEHIRKSQGRAFRVIDADCAQCEFVFRKRTRLSKPSRCPKCRSERIDGPAFTLNPDSYTTAP